MTGEPRSRAPLFVAGTLIAIAAATLITLPDQAAAVAESPPWCLICGSLGLIDVVLNIALFVPLGAGLQSCGVSIRRIALIAFLVSLGLELIQFTIPGRDPSLSDLLTNTTGGVIGGFAATWSRRLSRSSPRISARMTLGLASIWLMQTAAVGALLHPALPLSWYWGQLAPDLRQFEQFDGQVRSAEVGTRKLIVGRLANSAEIRGRLLEGQSLRAWSTLGTTRPGLAPIVSIFDQHQREIVLLGRWGDDLVFRFRTRTFDARLRPPAVRLVNVFSDKNGIVELAGRWDPHAGTFDLSMQSAAGRTHRVVPLNAQWGWSLLLPFPYAHGRESPWLTAVWVAAWLGLLGYWSAAWNPRAVGGALLVGAVGLGMLPLWLGLRPAGPAVWATAFASIVAGAVLAIRPARGERPPRRKA